MRVWGSVMVDGSPQLEIRDLPPGGFIDATPEFRIWKWACLGGDLGYEDESCVRRRACSPAKPCAKCIATAKTWWQKWQDRTDDRKWRATDEVENQHRTKSAKFCQHEKGHDHDEAIQCARELGFPRVVEMDGFGKRLQYAELQENK